MKEYNEQVVETLDDAGCIIANKNIIIDNIQARVRELEAEVERLSAAHVKARQANADSQAELAAEQLNNKLLRVALEAVIKVHGYESGIPVEAISTQASTEALDKYVAEKVNKIESCRDWYKRRIDLLKEWQRKMRDPERTIVCDIIANGLTMPEGGRYEIGKSDLSTITKQRDLAVEALEAIAKKCNLDMHGDDGSLGGYAYGIWNTANSTLSIIKESDAGT